MTVGIAAIANGGDDSKVVFAADRMMTVGARTGIEYEGADSKLEPIIESNPLTGIAVGSGTMALIDVILDRLNGICSDETPTDMGSLCESGVSAFQEVERETINNQGLSTIELTLDELYEQDVSVPSEIQSAILSEISDLRKSVRNNVSILLGGVSDGDAEIYEIRDADYSPSTRRGYEVIGSGTQSAQLTFIRNEYDSDVATVVDAIFAVAEAKVAAEERQGVGQKMDIAIVDADGVTQFEETETLREEIERINELQRSERERVIEEWADH